MCFYSKGRWKNSNWQTKVEYWSLVPLLIMSYSERRQLLYLEAKSDTSHAMFGPTGTSTGGGGTSGTRVLAYLTFMILS